MNQKVLYHFEEIVNEKYYSFSCQPGATYDDIDAAFLEFKKQFDVMKEKWMQEQAEAQAKADAEAMASSTPVDAELVA